MSPGLLQRARGAYPGVGLSTGRARRIITLPNGRMVRILLTRQVINIWPWGIVGRFEIPVEIGRS